MNAFDRHKQLVNNYLTYYGKGARNLFKPDKTKWKKDIDLARENHRFLWEVRNRESFRGVPKTMYHPKLDVLG